MAIDDLFALEPLIISKLQTDVPELKLVSSWGDFFKKGVASQITPAAYVIYGNYKARDGEKHRLGHVQLVTQRWMVALVIRNVKTTKTNKDVRTDAGPILFKIFKALNNASLSADHGNLSFVNSASPIYSSGVGVFPLAFESQFVIKST